MKHILAVVAHVTKARVIIVISLARKHLCIKLALIEARATMLLIIMMVELETLVYQNTKIIDNINLTHRDRFNIIITITIICNNTKL